MWSEDRSFDVVQRLEMDTEFGTKSAWMKSLQDASRNCAPM